MKLLDIQAAIGTAILLLSLPCEAKHAHQLSHLDAKRHNHKHSHKSIQASPRAEGIEEVLETRSGQCAFPNDPSMVAVTPDQQNAGWAMSPNQPCLPGNWCPYACAPPGVSKQWNPAATSYVYPLSMVCSSGSLSTDTTDTSRTVGSIATPMATCRKDFPTNLIVNREPARLRRRTHVPRTLRSARRFSLVTRPC